MKNLKIHIIAPMLIIFLFISHSYGQTIRTVGGGGANYSRLKLAFDAINSGSISGTIVLKITGNTNETSTAVLNASGSGSANYTSVTIYPTVTGLTISGNLSSSFISLNGADNVTFDGRVGAIGSTKSLTITNTTSDDGGGSSTIRFINDASNNSIKYCNLKGSTRDPNAGIVFFSTTTGTTGNDGNTIDNNNITNSTSTKRPVNAIYSSGTLAKDNSGNTISNNNIYDFLNESTNSNGIFLNANNTVWTITGNSFYETSSFAPNASAIYNAIYINSSSGNGFTVIGNFIGGNSVSCGGTAWTKTNVDDNPFTAININVGTVTSSSVQNNTIKNFNWGNSSTATWTGILLGAGSVNLGTINGNTIGANTGTNSITISHGASGGNVYGINITSSGTVDCQNNKIGSITATNSNWFLNSANIFAINKSATTGATTISNNTIGSTSTVNSINSNSFLSINSTNAQSVFGISNAGNGTIIISNNIIANLINGTTIALPSTSGVIDGIKSTDGANTISNNIIHDLSIGNANSSTTNTASVCGIVLTGATLKNVTGNTIYNLSNTQSSFTGNVIGLYFTGNTGANIVSANFIHSLSVTGATSTSASLYGIKIAAGTTTYSNNIISLGGNSKTTIYGIYGTGAANNNNNLYFNTIYIGGNLVSGTTNLSYALYSAVTTNIRNFRNNIFINARSTAGSSNKHYVAYFNYANNTNLTLDYNDYYTSGTGGVLGYYNNGNKSVLPIVTGKDGASLNTNPNFINAGSTVDLDYKIQIDLVGVNGTGITVDYGSNLRYIPAIGAWESGINKWKGSISNNWNTAANWTGNLVPALDANIVFDNFPLNHCQLDQDRSVTDITNAQSDYRILTNGHQLNIKGNLYLNNGAQIDASALNSTIQFSGTGTQTITSGAFYNNEVFNLNVNNYNNVTLNGTLILLNSLSTTSGRLDASNNTSTVVYSGLSPQSIGSNIYLNDLLYNLIIDNAAGITLTNNNPTIVLNDLTINIGKLFEIAPAKQLQVNGIFTNNAGIIGFIIHSDATGTGNLIHNTSGVAGTVQRYLTGNATNKPTHYLSSPVNNAPLSNIWQTGDYNIYWYNEKNPSPNKNIGWIRISGNTATLKNARAYAVINQYPNRTNNFAGNLNVPSDLLSKVSVSYTFSDTAASDGWNLIGNPYPCAINAQTFLNDNLSNFDFGYAAIYYWNDIDGVINNSQDYATRNLIGGTAATGNPLNTPNNQISIGQGFFVKSKPGATSFSLAATQRTTNTSSQFYITSDQSEIQRAWVSVNGPNDLYNEILVGFVDGATTGIDESYDAIKLKGNSDISLYSIIPSIQPLLPIPGQNEDFAIQGLPPISEKTEVKLGIDVGITSNYTFRLKNIENFDPQMGIYLKDLVLGTITDLRKDSSYTIALNPGEYRNRFLLQFYRDEIKNDIYEIESSKQIDIYTTANKIHVTGNSINTAYPLTITDITGKLIGSYKINPTVENEINIDALAGIYFVSIITDKGMVTKKILCNFNK